MANYREIVTKAVIGKGKKTFSNHYTLVPEESPSTILGCWVINHKFEGIKLDNKIAVEGSCDVNIWYSYDNDTKTIVSKQRIDYYEVVQVQKRKQSDISSNEEIIIRSLKQPVCTKVDIINNKIEYDIEKELGIEIVGDTKMRIAVDDNEDDWDEIIDIGQEDKIMKDIDESVKEKFITDEK